MYTAALLWPPKKPYTLAGFEPWPPVTEANAMSTAPRRRARVKTFNFIEFERRVFFRPRNGVARWYIFQIKNPDLGKFLEGLAMEDVNIFYVHLVYFMAVFYILCPFGIFYVNLVYFPPFWYIAPRKIWQPCCEALIVFLFLVFLLPMKDGSRKYSWLVHFRPN
jgi:hypothetical protein